MSSSSYNPDHHPAQNPASHPDQRAALAPSASVTPFAESARMPAAGSAPLDPPRFRPQVLRSLRMHPRTAAVCGAIVFLAIVYVALMQGKAWQAQSLVYVEPMASHSLTDTGTGGFDQFRYGSLLDQQMQTVTRPDVLTTALHSLPAHTWTRPKESEQTAVLRLQKALIVERVLTSYQMSIKLKTDSAKSAALIVNAVTKAYLESGRSDEVNASKERQNLLFEERQRLNEQLIADQREQMELGSKLGVANPEYSVNNPFDAETTNLRLQLATARQAHDVAAAQLSSVSGQDSDHKSGLAASADDTLTTDMGLSSLKTAVNARRALLQSQMAGLTPMNPAYKQDQDELADLERSVDTMAAQMRNKAEHHIQDKLRTELERTASIESQLNDQLAQQTAKATGAGPRLQRASELGFDIQRLQAQYSKVDEALHAAELQSNGPGMAHIALEASIPAQPEPSHRGLFLLAAVPLSLLFGCLGAVIARARDLHIYRGDDLEQAIGFAPIAVLPARNEVAARVLDQYMLRLAAGIETAYRTAAAQTFVVTAVSATTDTAELVQTLAHKLRNMRLDVTVKRAGDLLILSQQSAEYLARDHAGNIRPNPLTEGVATLKLGRLKNEHGIVLIDAPPLLHSAETEYAARCSDAILLVAESTVTLRPEVNDATALLARLRIRGIAAVLTDVPMQHADASFLAAVQLAERRSATPANSHVPEQATPFVPVPSVPVPSASAARAQSPAVSPLGVVPRSESPNSGLASPLLANAARPATVAQEHSASDYEQAHEPAHLDEHQEEPDIVPHRSIPTAFGRFRSPEAEAMLKSFLDADPTVRPAAHLVAELKAVTWAASTREEPSPHSSGLAAELAFAREPQSHANALLPAILPVSAMPSLPPARAIAAQPIQAQTRMPLIEVDTTGFPAEPVEDSLEREDRREADSMGRLVSEEDLVEAVPHYTRSRIRLAFKEEEVNSKTTWFSKLFRGDSPSSVRSAVAQEASDALPAQPAAGAADPIAPREPEFEHLMSRITSRAFPAQGAAQVSPVDANSHAKSISKIAIFPHPAHEPNEEQSAAPEAAAGLETQLHPRPERAQTEQSTKPVWLDAVGFAGSLTDDSASASASTQTHSLPEIKPGLLRRFDPIAPLRAEPAPWHQRLSRPEQLHATVLPVIDVPAATHSVEERAPASADADLWKPRAITFPRPAAPETPAPALSAADSRPEVHAAALASPASRPLTRRWGLLSQYDQAKTDSLTDTLTGPIGHRPDASAVRFREER